MRRQLKTFLTYGIATDDLSRREKAHWIFWFYVVVGMLTYYFVKDLKHDHDHMDGNWKHDPDYDMFAEAGRKEPIAHLLADQPTHHGRPPLDTSECGPGDDVCERDPHSGEILMCAWDYDRANKLSLNHEDFDHPTVAEGTTPTALDVWGVGLLLGSRAVRALQRGVRLPSRPS